MLVKKMLAGKCLQYYNNYTMFHGPINFFSRIARALYKGQEKSQPIRKSFCGFLVGLRVKQLCWSNFASNNGDGRTKSDTCERITMSARFLSIRNLLNCSLHPSQQLCGSESCLKPSLLVSSVK